MINTKVLNSLKLFTVVFIGLLILSSALMAQTCSFGGSYSSKFGQIKLNQNGSQVTGTIDNNGKIVGTAQGYILQGTWWKGGTYNPPQNGGEVIFYISPDCKKLLGDWRYGSDAHGYGWSKQDWIATRTAYAPKPPSYPPPPKQPDYVQQSGGYGLPTYNNNSSSNSSGNSYNKPMYNILCNWDGLWQTKTGQIEFATTSATGVEGRYVINSKSKGTVYGTMKGTASGNQLSGTWSEGPSYKAPNDAGQFVFTISPSCNSYSGTWRNGYNQHYNQWQKGWHGTKIK